VDTFTGLLFAAERLGLVGNEPMASRYRAAAKPLFEFRGSQYGELLPLVARLLGRGDTSSLVVALEHIGMGFTLGCLAQCGAFELEQCLFLAQSAVGMWLAGPATVRLGRPPSA
jgi:hypothetical protein